MLLFHLDLLFAAFAKGEICPKQVELLSPILDRQLKDQGYAETRLHVGAALEFSTLWAGAVQAIAKSDLKEQAFESPGAGLNEGKKLALGWCEGSLPVTCWRPF